MDQDIRVVITAEAGGVVPAVNKVTDSMNRMKKSAGESTQVLSNLSRVAQDAPYGFIGIANNINPLIESFQRLQVSSKDTGGVFKNLSSALIGPAGIGLAVGVISSLLVKFGDDLFSSATESKKLADAINLIGEAADRAKNDITGFKGAIAFGDEFEGLRIKIGAFGAVGDGNIQVLEKQISSQKELVDRIKLQRELLKKAQADALDAEINAKIGSKAREAAEETGRKLHSGMTDLIGQEAEASKKLAILEQTINLTRLQNQKETNTKEDAENKKRLAALKKYRDDWASMLLSFKRLQKEISGHEGFIPDVNLTDPQAANPFVRGFQDSIPKVFDSSLLKLEVDDKIKAKMLEKGKSIGDALGEGMGNVFKNILGKKLQVALDAGKSTEEVGKIGRKINTEFRLVAKGLDIAGETITNLFDRIKAGENPLKAFFQTIKDSILSLIESLIAAAAQAALLSLFTGGASGGGTSFLKAFGAITGIGGGNVNVARGQGFGQVAGLGFSGQLIQVEVAGRLRGNDILLSGSRQLRLNGRTG